MAKSNVGVLDLIDDIPSTASLVRAHRRDHKKQRNLSFRKGEVQSELTQSAYDSIKKALNGGLSDNKASAQFHVGKVRVALVRRSNTYQGYLRIRKNEAKKRLESIPAKAVPGINDLPQENQEFLAQTDDGKSLPADQTKTDTNGTHDIRPKAEQDAEAKRKADMAKEAEARRLNAEYAKRERRAAIGSYIVLGFAFVGIGSLGVWLFNLVFQ